jgi:transcriptional regulator with XRE-family HTH domain
MDTSDTTWVNLAEPWERLQWARKRAGFTQESFASSVGMKRGAYLKYEAAPGHGNTRLRFEQATKWAPRLKVRWEWLLDRGGSPWLEEPSAGERTRRALDGILPPEEVEQIANLAELFEKRLTGT